MREQQEVIRRWEEEMREREEEMRRSRDNSIGVRRLWLYSMRVSQQRQPRLKLHASQSHAASSSPPFSRLW